MPNTAEDEELFDDDCPDLEELAKALRDRYYHQLQHVNVDQVYFVKRDGKRKKSGKPKVAEISGAGQAWARFLLQKVGLGKKYCVMIEREPWTQLTETTRQWLMFDLLYSIDPDGGGKLRPKAVEEHDIIAEYFSHHPVGIFWRAFDGSLPDMLAGEVIDLPLPYIPGNEDED